MRLVQLRLWRKRLADSRIPPAVRNLVERDARRDSAKRGPARDRSPSGTGSAGRAVWISWAGLRVLLCVVDLRTNRLARETSPYLLQHRHNPVDWYPWGSEAFDRARVEDRPILLSVGYSSCHWCHVMAHESFEDEATAELMNRHFVNVKVDREERPDVDAVYMGAVQAMTGHGGWPMTVVMTPERRPFFAGTYFPAEERFGQPAFTRVLRSIIDIWERRRDEVEQTADRVTDHLNRLFDLPTGTARAGREGLGAALKALQGQFDPRYGGFGGAPKFPPHAVLRFLLRQPDGGARAMAYQTLTRMARGGIFDQLGGGFARYSVDGRWLIPHFEKMLYDNAQLVGRYAEAFHQTGAPLYRHTVEATLAWVEREMTSPEGGFYSALDADSEGVEGKFYTWDLQEIERLLAADADLVATYYGVTEAGNFEGRSILEVPHEERALADRFGLTVGALQERLERARALLFEAREERVRPGLDDKILTAWNGLMLGGYAEAGRLLGRADYLGAASRNASFLRQELYRDGRLLHSYKDGEAKIEGLLEDYAFFGLGLLSLYRATFEAEWLGLAIDLAAAVAEHFRDPRGGFFSTPSGGEELIARPKNIFDAATPAEGVAAAELLLRVGRLTGEGSYEELASEAVRPALEPMRSQPRGFGTALTVVETLLSPPREVVIVGRPGAEDTLALLDALRTHDLSYAAEVLSEGPDDPLVRKVPFLRGRGVVDGRATAYVCEGGACRLPVTTAAGLAEQLGAIFNP